MFLVGLDFDPSHYRKNNLVSLVISQSGILIPFAFGSVLALWMYPQFCSATTSRITFMLFTGAAMSVTAFPVLARILTERGILDTRIGSMTITCGGDR